MNLLYLLVLVHVASSAVPLIQLFDGEDFSGASTAVAEGIDDLETIELNDKISSYCINQSLWLMYENENFNQVPGFVHIGGVYQYGCESIPLEYDNQVSSIRFAGSASSALNNALNIFSGSYYSGEKSTLELEVSRLQVNAGSFIVNGRSSWTVYSLFDYQGDAVCLSPADPADAQPGFFPTPEDSQVAWPIRSVQRGCWAKTVGIPVEIPQQTKISVSENVHYVG